MQHATLYIKMLQLFETGEVTTTSQNIGGGARPKDE